MVQLPKRLEDMIYRKTELDGLESVRRRLEEGDENLFSLIGPQKINLDAQSIYEEIDEETPNRIIYIEKPLGKWEIRLEYDDIVDRLMPSRGGNAYKKDEEEEDWKYSVT